MPLTDTACKNAKCPAGRPRERLSDSGGLYLEVQPNGAKHWRWKYRFGGKEKRLALGTYPTVTLAQARRDRDDARILLKNGTDPVQAKIDTKHARRTAQASTFKAAALAWFDHWGAERSPRHAAYVHRRLEMDVFPIIGNKPLAEVTAPQLVAMARKIESRGAVDLAKRSLQTCGQIFRWAVSVPEFAIDRNPVADIRPGDVLKPRRKENYARVDVKDLPQLLRKIEAYDGSPLTRFAMQLMAMTFVRTGELIGARWEEFDIDAAEWRIPPARMKMKTVPHIVPLARQALHVLALLQEHRNLSPLVFPGERDHEQPMSNGTILAALRRMGYAGKMTGHGFRGIASTILHEQGFDHAHIELQLAHMERDDTSAAYNYATYLGPRRAMMQAWADHLDALRIGAKVLPFKAA